MQKKYLDLKNFFFYLNKNHVRYLRGRGSSKITTSINSENHSKTIISNNDKSSINVINEKVDLKNSNLSTIARLSIENDPELMKSIGDKLQSKRLKFSFDPKIQIENFNNQSKDDKTLLKLSKELNKSSSKPKENQIIQEEEYEDPNHPISNIDCSGCGAKLHCQSESIDGFIPANRFKLLTKHDLEYYVCNRCQQIKLNQKLINTVTKNNFDYDKFILEKICSQKKAHVILLVDLLNIPNSIYDGWSKLIKTKDTSEDKNKKHLSAKLKKNDDEGIDICIIGNKFDLLPNTGPQFRESIINCILKNCHDKGIYGDQVKYIELISAKNGYNIEKVVSALFELWNDEGDVYLLGMANAGKSVFFNQLLSSDYCRALASDALNRATTSFWPGTTLNTLKFPITFLNEHKLNMRAARLINDREKLFQIQTKQDKYYEKNKNLKDSECFGLVGSTFKPFSAIDNKIDASVDSTYKLDELTGKIKEGENYETGIDIKKKRIDDARQIYNHKLYKNRAAWFYDTPGVLGELEILRNFSKKELEIAFPIGIIMPRIYWMTPGQTLLVGGLIRIDLLESTNNERVLFSIMASPALPIVNPFNTIDAERLYDEYYEQGNVLRVPHKNHQREKPLPKLESKQFEINCIGNYKSTADLVFSCFGFAAVTSRPETKAIVRAFTLGGMGLQLRQPSLLPYIVNLRQKWDRKDGSQSFKSIYYKKPKLNF